MRELKLYRLTATEILALFKKGEFTVEEYARSLLRYIYKRDEIVKAWVYLSGFSSFCYGAIDGRTYQPASDPHQIIRQAQALDQIPHDERKPLHGVAVAIKDAINTKGIIQFSHWE